MVPRWCTADRRWPGDFALLHPDRAARRLQQGQGSAGARVVDGAGRPARALARGQAGGRWLVAALLSVVEGRTGGAQTQPPRADLHGSAGQFGRWPARSGRALAAPDDLRAIPGSADRRVPGHRSGAVGHLPQSVRTVAGRVWRDWRTERAARAAVPDRRSQAGDLQLSRRGLAHLPGGARRGGGGAAHADDQLALRSADGRGGAALVRGTLAFCRSAHRPARHRRGASGYALPAFRCGADRALPDRRAPAPHARRSGRRSRGAGEPERGTAQPRRDAQGPAAPRRPGSRAVPAVRRDPEASGRPTPRAAGRSGGAGADQLAGERRAESVGQGGPAERDLQQWRRVPVSDGGGSGLGAGGNRGAGRYRSAGRGVGDCPARPGRGHDCQPGKRRPAARVVERPAALVAEAVAGQGLDVDAAGAAGRSGGGGSFGRG